ncbi:MAG TPA: dethiobiotin synthase [Myxococcales bacterium LLY-WYZ-16_1]|nr:dethiobiotin synthase [Myxococcales bacterium LLY-WYZ-16_1]
MKGIFVTGTGTDIGKTFVSCGILRWLRDRGVPVAPRKPVISGFDPNDLAASDTGQLLAAAGLGPDAVDRVSPFRFRDPLSPDMAARREGRRLRLQDILQALEASREPGAFHLIEGVGGVRVPVEDPASGLATVREWIRSMDLPVVLVAGTYLGTLSHTLTAVDALEAAGLSPSWLVLSQSDTEPVPPQQTQQTLDRWLPRVPSTVVPRLAPSQRRGFRLALPPHLAPL